MKKALVLLALSLTSLSLLAADFQRLNIAGYRIGDSEIMANDDRRIVATNNASEIQYYDVIGVADNRDASNAYFNVSVPAGQEVKKWLAYNSDPTVSLRPPTETNQLAGAVTEYVWGYNAADTSPKYIVVDFDYITYTLKYNGNGSTSGSMSSESHIYTNEFNLASNQFSKKGYSFNGWTNETGTVFADEALVSGVSFGVTYTNTTTKTATLYANWKPNTYTVTFDPCGGSVVPESTNVTYDAAWPVLPTPTRTDYRFDGWYKADGSSIVTTGAVKLTEDLALSARWTRLFTATFVDEIGHETNSVVVASNTVPVTSWQPYHEGFKFNGWNPETNRLDRSMTFTALFSGVDYIVTLHANFGSPEATEDMTFSYGTAKTLVVNAFERLGYEFKGWADSQDGNAKYCKNGTEESVLNPAKDLYAVWKPITHSISFDANGGEGKMEDVSVEYGEVYTVTNCTFTKTGVGFVGWTTNVANGAEFYVDDGVSNLTTIAGAIVTFYAIWSEPRYIAFDGNGADDATAMADDVMTFKGVETKTLVSNKFERTGYTFAGWATNETTAAALNVVYTNYAEVVSTNLWMAIGETNVLYAAWQTNSYTVVFNRNGGTGSMGNQVFYYDQAQELTRCEFGSNLEFQGWATSQTGDKIFDDKATVSNLTADANGIVMLYAVWDNGYLSKAMHCDNLFWESVDDGGGSSWGIAAGAGEGYNPSGSSITNRLTRPMNKSYDLKPSAKGSGSGKLSFWYKTSDNNCWLRMRTSNSSEGYIDIDPSTDWVQYGPSNIVDISYVAIEFHRISGTGSTVWIDQMKWLPDGQEPTDEDSPTISGFTKTTDGFTLSVDGGNISDSFSYQILATNELVSGDWPVKETLTADELKAGYEISIEENEPKMFYKVRVISK